MKHTLFCDTSNHNILAMGHEANLYILARFYLPHPSMSEVEINCLMYKNKKEYNSF